MQGDHTHTNEHSSLWENTVKFNRNFIIAFTFQRQQTNKTKKPKPQSIPEFPKNRTPNLGELGEGCFTDTLSLTSLPSWISLINKAQAYLEKRCVLQKSSMMKSSMSSLSAHGMHSSSYRQILSRSNVPTQVTMLSQNWNPKTSCWLLGMRAVTVSSLPCTEKGRQCPGPAGQELSAGYSCLC